MTQRLGRRRYALLSQHALYVAVSRGLAVTYFVLALGFFWLPRAADLSSPGVCVATAVLVLFSMLIVCAAADLGTRIGRRIPVVPRGWLFLAHGAALAGIGLYLSVMQGAIPPLIYEFF
jgi:prepilin signal peptidase PulO-like enzyme (type II secretory pathway)